MHKGLVLIPGIVVLYDNVACSLDALFPWPRDIRVHYGACPPSLIKREVNVNPGTDWEPICELIIIDGGRPRVVLCRNGRGGALS